MRCPSRCTKHSSKRNKMRLHFLKQKNNNNTHTHTKPIKTKQKSIIVPLVLYQRKHITTLSHCDCDLRKAVPAAGARVYTNMLFCRMLMRTLPADA